ncbi:EAL and HDOD domain-containing protein [Desulfopila aestuarii]|uniref:EAL and modified HD-GYP domain-containing signal transduction protein n=1 Tax=Desulfopila aestuarii DSM 18488 TaxID=1121416 RepID=A0A1M7YKF7_9BACT|nr:HDOD domain-containing protein [Desulfopila aestuarii]SHO53115.1 EAL and modified HD-GYP domain-containing signal transduction protein [Desulfopila aestuarii DSM 18488]
MTSGNSIPYHDAFFAHQPVFDGYQRVWCYEIYFVDSNHSGSTLFASEESLKTSMEVLANIGLCPDKLLKGTKVIINFTEHAIEEKLPYSLHSQAAIVQVKDSPRFSRAFLKELAAMKRAGFSLSIDDFKAYPNNFEAYGLADIATINAKDNDEMQIRQKMQAFAELPITFLAKKIETPRQFQQLKELGFGLFQGYFFKRPKTEKVRKVSSNERVRFELMEQLCAKDLDFDTLSSLITRDVSLSMRLINMLNSPIYGLVSRIGSLKQALVYLGISQLKQWLRVILLTDLEQPDTTKELMRISLQRAKFLETISCFSGWHEEDNRLFLVGLFSLLDAILQVPMVAIVDCLAALEDEIKQTLLKEETKLSSWLQLVDSFENSDWDKAGILAAGLHLDSYQIMDSYTMSLEWANKALAGSLR